jgi:hypothetical protein
MAGSPECLSHQLTVHSLKMNSDILNETEITCLRLIMQVGLARMSDLVQTSNILVSVAVPVSAQKAQLELDAQKLDEVFPELKYIPKKPGPRAGVAGRINPESKTQKLISHIRDAINSGLTKPKDIKFFALSKEPAAHNHNYADAIKAMKDLVKNNGKWSLTVTKE